MNIFYKLILTVSIGAVVYAVSLTSNNVAPYTTALLTALLYMIGIYTGKILFGGYHTHLKMPGSEKSALCGEHTDNTEVTETLEDVDCEICLKNEIIRLNGIMGTAGIV